MKDVRKKCGSPFKPQTKAPLRRDVQILKRRVQEVLTEDETNVFTDTLRFILS